MLNQEAFTTLVHTVATHDAFKGIFAGSAMAKSPGEEATMWFKGALDPEMQVPFLRTLIANAEDIQNMRSAPALRSRARPRMPLPSCPRERGHRVLRQHGVWQARQNPSSCK